MEREIKKQEAIERMKLLGLHKNVIREFEKENILNLSEHGGMLYWLTTAQQIQVEEFEEEHNAVVYHIIHDYTEFGELLTLLYVSDYEEEWEYDRDDLHEGYPLAYVVNLDDNSLSEFGSVGVIEQFGGLVRTA